MYILYHLSGELSTTVAEYSCVHGELSCFFDKNVVSWKHTYEILAKPKLDAQEPVNNYGVTIMEVSYKKLWKLLIDKDMKKKDLQSAAGISWSSVTKLSKGETVSMEVLMKICKVLNCDIGDIMELLPEEAPES